MYEFLQGFDVRNLETTLCKKHFLNRSLAMY